jgi:hypothetical protein
MLGDRSHRRKDMQGTMELRQPTRAVQTRKFRLMNNQWNLAVRRQDPWSSERSFNMFDSSIHECRSSTTRSFWHNLLLQESLPNVFEQLKGSPCQIMLQDSSSRSMPALGIESLLCCHICAKWMARVLLRVPFLWNWWALCRWPATRFFNVCDAAPM